MAAFLDSKGLNFAKSLPAWLAIGNHSEQAGFALEMEITDSIKVLPLYETLSFTPLRNSLISILFLPSSCKDKTLR